MKKFWAYISNGKYSVGTTGQTVYLFDENDNEINRFQDITYAYTPMFSPDGKLLVVKSTAGRLAVYSLETFSLIKKFRFSKVDGAQDEGFCFSPDGKYFINIELQGDDLHCAISVYNTDDFSRVSQLFLEESVMLNHIEFDYSTKEYYVLGIVRGDVNHGLIAKYQGDSVVDLIKIAESEYDFYRSYMALKMSGFTEKTYEWSYMDDELDELKSMNLTLAKLYDEHRI